MKWIYQGLWKHVWLVSGFLLIFIDQVKLTYVFDDFGAFISFPKWDFKNSRLLEFEFATNETTALLMYTDDKRSKFFELKLHDGVLKLRLNFGNISSLYVGKNLNDNQYHKVFVFFDQQMLTLGVDENQDSIHSPDIMNVENFDNNIYFGGIPGTFLKDLSSLSIPSVYFVPHFRGKMRNIFYLNNTSKQFFSLQYNEMFGVEIIKETSLQGCYLNNLCLNGGRCIYVDGKTQCDCRNTIFHGKFCETERIRAVFDPPVGMISITNVPNDLTNIDLTFDFMTSSSDCLLVYIDNSQNKKYLQIKLKKSYFIAAYWIKRFLKVFRLNKNFADRLFHNVQIKQMGKNIIVKVDNLLVNSSNYEELTELILSPTPLIEIGGQINPETEEIDEAFIGTISDITLNGHNILEIVNQKNSNVKIEGNVLLQNFSTVIRKLPDQDTTTDNGKPLDDEFEFSGSGSGSGCIDGDSLNCDQEGSAFPEKNETIPQSPACTGDDCEVKIITDDFYYPEATNNQNSTYLENVTSVRNKIGKEAEVVPKIEFNQPKVKTSSLNVYLILGLVAEGIILLIILSFAIYKFTKCAAEKKSQQYNLVPNESKPNENNAHKVKGNTYYA